MVTIVGDFESLAMTGFEDGLALFDLYFISIYFDLWHSKLYLESSRFCGKGNLGNMSML
jgi:hypothetical protein